MDVLLLTFCFAAFCSTTQSTACDNPLVRVQQGWLRGKVQDAILGGFQFYSFENIPYAKPPVGTLRFKAPEEAASWEGIRDATALGPMCPQYNPLTKKLTPGCEDCLTLNVYSSNLTAKTPVIVYFPGFAYKFDGDYVDLYGADFLVKDVVVVTFNCRKDALGFLNLGTKDVPGNAALKDQVTMLRWVRNNIDCFGGDPDSVTVAGISSGSASIGHHLMSPMSTGLFHRAIMISGVPSCDAIFPYKVKEKSYVLGKLLGLDTKNGCELLNFLQCLPYNQLINTTCEVLAAEQTTNQLLKKMVPFVPVVEEDFGQERFILEDFMTDLDCGLLNQVEVMIGYSDTESLIVIEEFADYLIKIFDRFPEMFVPNKIQYHCTPNDILDMASIIKEFYFGDKPVSIDTMKEFVDCNSHSCMIYDVLSFAKKVSQFTATYLFEFRSISRRNFYGQEGVKYGIVGASHADPAFYMFNPKPLNMTIDIDCREYALIRQFVNPIINFATCGDPTPGANAVVDWPLFTTENLDYLEFTDTMTLKQDPSGEDCQFWDWIYDLADFPIYPYRCNCGA